MTLKAYHLSPQILGHCMESSVLQSSVFLKGSFFFFGSYGTCHPGLAQVARNRYHLLHLHSHPHHTKLQTPRLQILLSKSGRESGEAQNPGKEREAAWSNYPIELPRVHERKAQGTSNKIPSTALFDLELQQLLPGKSASAAAVTTQELNPDP